LSEAYPDLKANQNMLALQEELTSTENKISFARQAFNDAATAYNNQRQVFPAVLVANTLGFTPAELLQAEEAAREAPKVSFK
jgi:LemA protein